VWHARRVVPDELAAALVAEAARKSRVCWVAWDAHAPRLVWHVWHDGALVVLSGADQPLPGIDVVGTATVVMRSKDTGGRLVSWTGTVEVVEAGTERWDEHAAALLAVRLNLTDPPAALAEWRAGARIVRLRPLDAADER
jgi:hypothetical protein